MSVRTRRRILATAQGLAGAALAARPERVIAAVSGSGSRPAAWIVQVLGVRMSVQAVITVARPTRSVELAGAAGDLAHAASMAWVARRLPHYRRAALASGITAAAFAVASLDTLCADRRQR